MTGDATEPANSRRGVAGIVLAGGRARRFDGDKLAALVHGETILSRATAAVASVAELVIVVGGAPPPGGSPAPGGSPPSTAAPPPGGSLQSAAAPPGAVVRILPDGEPFGGPLRALADVLGRSAGADGDEQLAIIVGGDMPTLVPAVLAAMLDRLAVDESADAVVLEAPDAPRRQVLPMAVRTAAGARAVTGALEAGDRSLHGLLERLTTVELPAGAWRTLDPAGASLADVDTRADLARLNSAGREGRTGP